MALPTTIVSAGLPLGRLIPIQRTGAYYALAINGSRISVYKTSDPTTSWTEQDSANRPLANHAAGPVDYVVDGFVLIVVGWGNGSYYYHAYSFLSDQWSTVDEIIETPGTNPVYPWISIADVRSDGDVLVAYAGGSDRVMGGDKERADYARRELGVWTVGIELGSPGADIHYGQPQIVKSSGADIHHIYFWDETDTADPPTTTGVIYGRSVDGSNGISNIRTLFSHASALPEMYPLSNPISYDSGGTELIRVLIRFATDGRVVMSLESSGDILAESPEFVEFQGSATEPIIGVNGESPIFSLVRDPTFGVLYAVYADATDNDIYIITSSDNGDTWSGATEILDGVTCNRISATLYDKGGQKVLAYVYDDGGVTKYNEYNLTPTLTALSDGDLSAVEHSFVGPFEA